MPRSDLLAGSLLYAWTQRLASGVRSAAPNALIVRLLRRVTRQVSTAVSRSRAGAAVGLVARWIRTSWVYHWLTDEPESDVVVIDLRRTWTVGPLIAIADRVLEPAQRFWPQSGTRTVLSGTAVRVRAAPIRLLGVLLAVLVLADLVQTAVSRGLTGSGLGLRLCLLAAAVGATRIDTSWQQLREGPIGQAFEPPKPPK
jgi:hypothetical protein